jgi:lipoprotein-anchoring transpeptidase ErfK/SrfK
MSEATASVRDSSHGDRYRALGISHTHRAARRGLCKEFAAQNPPPWSSNQSLFLIMHDHLSHAAAGVRMQEVPRMRLIGCFLLGLGLFMTAGEAAQKRSWFSGVRIAEGYVPPAVVAHQWSEAPGTVIVDTTARRLFLILPYGKARRYTVAVGRDGFGWRGTAVVGRRAQWPEWIPPREMTARAARHHRFLPYSLDGGALNPLGARALYLFQGKRDTLIRIHGTNDPKSVGRSVSSGCIRLRNEDIIDLYGRVVIGTKVVIH